MTSPISLRGFLAFTICVTSFCGCTTIKSLTPSFAAKPPAIQPVVDVLALWQPGEGRDTRGLPTRGFAGQVFFFAAGSRCPIDIDGDVSIVVFDDFGTLEEQKEPLHEFHFRDGVWQNFRQDTNLGPAFQLFIPYTRDGAHQARCSLRVKYTDKADRQVISEAATVLLVGETAPTAPVEIFGNRQSTRSLKTERILSGDAANSLSRSQAKTPSRTNSNRSSKYDVERIRSEIETAGFEVPAQRAPNTATSTVQQTSYQLKPRQNPADIAKPVEPTDTVSREKLNSHWPDSRSTH